MIHYFFVEDFEEDVNKIYTIKANSEEEAKQIFCKNFVPYLNTYFDWIVELFGNKDVYIKYIGSEEDIIKLSNE